MYCDTKGKTENILVSKREIINALPEKQLSLIREMDKKCGVVSVIYKQLKWVKR